MFGLSFLTFGLSWLVMPFIYNKKYITSLLENSYRPATDSDRIILVTKGIIADEVMSA